MILTNGRIITNDADNNFYQDGAIFIKDNYIGDIGPREEILEKYPDEEVVDVKGRLMMPGMICGHSHIYSAYARGMAASNP
ncbi:MAG: chlorohydrolase, partial [Anaerococcus sp.]|nr:chlorohydrolase [Anaerococcus sp.]